jgi:hypothetical protein
MSFMTCKISVKIVRFRFLVAVTMIVTVIWSVLLYSSEMFTSISEEYSSSILGIADGEASSTKRHKYLPHYRLPPPPK